jgi:flagellin
MALSILNNIAGLNAQNQLNINNVNLNTTLLRLSSGKRINSGADDPAGLGIASSLKANALALNQATQNANDGISVAQIADGALSQISNLLTSGFTLAEEAATDTVDSNGRTALNNQLTSIKTEIQRIAAQTNYNGVSIFSTTATSKLNGALHVFVGDTAASSSISVTIATITATSVGGVDISGTDLGTSKDTAAAAITTLKTALSGITTSRAAVGAGINQLQSAVSVLQTTAQNTTAAESNIEDANMAQEISNMTKYQILAQTGIAALTQANSTAQNVLTLLKG